MDQRVNAAMPLSKQVPAGGAVSVQVYEPLAIVMVCPVTVTVGPVNAVPLPSTVVWKDSESLRVGNGAGGAPAPTVSVDAPVNQVRPAKALISAFSGM